VAKVQDEIAHGDFTNVKKLKSLQAKQAKYEAQLESAKAALEKVRAKEAKHDEKILHKYELKDWEKDAKVEAATAAMRLAEDDVTRVQQEVADGNFANVKKLPKLKAKYHKAMKAHEKVVAIAEKAHMQHGTAHAGLEHNLEGLEHKHLDLENKQKSSKKVTF
jgi:hypothetical protein